MIKRCIMIFPVFENMEIIEHIRMRYDPIYEKVKPHITLVFPFESTLSKQEIHDHVHHCVNDIPSFDICLSGFEKHHDYLFLNLRKGKHYLIKMHKQLYTGILKPFYPEFLHTRRYIPHITVGRSLHPEEQEDGYQKMQPLKEKFSTCVKQVEIEIIGPREETIIESVVKLNNKKTD